MRENRPLYPDFEAVWKFCEKGLGIDIGCGTKRLSPDILALDAHYHGVSPNMPDLIWNASNLGEVKTQSPSRWFRDEVFDFIFSSHCLEDFVDIAAVLIEWWRKLKIGGHMVLLLPDMQGGRYPKVGDPDGNPSHRTDVGVEYMRSLTKKVFGDACEIVQCDTIREGCTFDFVARRRR